MGSGRRRAELLGGGNVRWLKGEGTMMMQNRHQVLLVGLVVVALLVSGCAESVTVASNGLAMLVASVLLWSTINLGND